MNGSIRKWIVGTFLLGALAFAGAPGAQAQSRMPYESRQGTVVDLRQDMRELHAWKEQIERDKLAIREDAASYGENSPQVSIDRARLARDERELQRVKRDIRADQHFVHVRHYLWRQPA
jgi:hypothetical protein